MDDKILATLLPPELVGGEMRFWLVGMLGPEIVDGFNSQQVVDKIAEIYSGGIARFIADNL